jgi:putative SOS response-associated peptidase YedK
MYKIYRGGDGNMCGRFTQKSERKIITEDFYIQEFLSDVYICYNIAPGQNAGIVFRDRVNTYAQFRWGLVPFWADDPKIGYRMINARAETVAQKPSFKRAFVKRRCIVPADGFFEWRKGGAYKTPFFVTHRSGRPMGFAGLWEVWRPKELREKEKGTGGALAGQFGSPSPDATEHGEVNDDVHRNKEEGARNKKKTITADSKVQGDLFSVETAPASDRSSDSSLNTSLYTFTIITTNANDKMRELHDRMPVMIPPSRRAEWLDPDNGDTSRLLELLVPSPNEEIEFYEVSRMVNSPKNNSPECIQPLG